MSTPPSTRHRRLSAWFEHFAEAECSDAPLYQAICRVVAGDPALLDLLGGASEEQQRPNLWLAAVHERLLAGAAHPLRDYYDTVGGARAPDDALEACLRDFVHVHDAALRERMRTASTQTNEVGRCAVLWPALHAVAGRVGNPRLALLDVGCSAGLNLGVDVYAGTTGAAGGPMLQARRIGERHPPTTGSVQIVQRLGIDPAPVDVADDGAVRWLRACLWPGDAPRAERLRQAVALARQHRWPVQRVADCTAFIADWLASVPAGVQPVVFNSWVLAYFEPGALARHIAAVTGLVRRTGAVWLSAEGPATRIGGPPAPAATAATANGTLWTLARRAGDGVSFEHLARSHAHGRWIEWLED